MTNSAEEILNEISERVFAVPIRVLWKSQEPLPRNGERRSQSRGSDGYEIVSRQEYELGDDPRDIDHYATAQSADDTIITVKFLEARDICVETIVDVGLSMQFGTNRVSKGILSAELTGSILACAEKTLDRASVTTTSRTQVEFKVGPRGPKTVFASALEAIIEPPDSIFVEPQTKDTRTFWESLSAPLQKAFGKQSAEAKPAIPVASGMCEALQGLSKRKSLVFLVSDFLNFTNVEKEALRDAATIHDVICVVIQDERERELPPGPGMYTLRDIVSGKTKTIWLNEANRTQFRQNAQKKLDELTAFFSDANCDWQVFSTEQDFDQVIPQMMQLFGGHRR
jgi:uncharacterized protein (DUF58 family)